MILEMFKYYIELYKLPWLILAILSWIAIYFTCSFKQFMYALPSGVWSMMLGTILEQFFVYHKFWTDKYLLIPIGELDLFVIIGPFFAIGLLFIRFLPRNKWSICLLIVLFSAIATGIELLSIEFCSLKYHDTKWSYLHSLFAYCIGLISTLGFNSLYYDKLN